MVRDARPESRRRWRIRMSTRTVSVALAVLTMLLAWAMGDGIAARALLTAAVAGLAVVVVADGRRRARSEALLAAAHQRLHDTIHSMPQAVAVYDRDLRLVVSNAAYNSLCPDPERYGVPGTPFRTILEVTVAAGMIDLGARTAEEWVEWRLAAVPLPPTERYWHDGRWLLSSEHRTADGGLVAIHTDITQLKDKQGELHDANASLAASGEAMRRQAEQLRRLNASMVAANRAAEEAMQARQRFFANMSHELRTPLNAIIGFADLIHAEVLGPIGAKYREYVADIRASGAHLLDLINNVLDMSRLTAGKYQIAPEQIEVDEVVASTLRMVHIAAEAAEVALVDAIAPQLPPLWADRRALTQSLLNLLSNAIKFTPVGGTVTVRVNADAAWFRIAVADTGIGIAKEHLARLAVPFEQVGTNDPSRPKGSGLGLALTKALVECHGGRLAIASEPGQGTEVAMEFPIPAEPGSRQPESAQEAA
jgi:two-component system cell cycle sensor histidine kinase PleC